MRSIYAGLTLILILGLMTVSGLVRSDAEGPDFWAVTGVKNNDVLNIREKPSASSKIIGSIPPNGDGITNISCIGEMSYEEYEKATDAQREKRKHDRWCKVSYKGLTGYVKGMFLTQGNGPAQ